MTVIVTTLRHVYVYVKRNKFSSQEKQKFLTEFQSLRQDTQVFRTEAYYPRTASSVDAATNERLRAQPSAQQQELERRGEDLLWQYVR